MYGKLVVTLNIANPDNLNVRAEGDKAIYVKAYTHADQVNMDLNRFVDANPWVKKASYVLKAKFIPEPMTYRIDPITNEWNWEVK